jgi:hypothetical protein
MDDQIGIVVYVSKEFDLKLREYMLSLEKVGVRKTKAETAYQLMTIGLQQESKLK